MHIYQAMIWNNDNVVNQTIPYPESYDWKKNGDSQWQPVVNTLRSAPDVVLHSVKTRCSSKCCAFVRSEQTCVDEMSENSLSQNVVSDADS